jgi:hypothetical protein
MKFHRIDQVQLVALLGEGKGMDAGPATHVENRSRCRWKISGENRLRPKPLEFTPTL